MNWINSLLGSVVIFISSLFGAHQAAQPVVVQVNSLNAPTTISPPIKIRKAIPVATTTVLIPVKTPKNTNGYRYNGMVAEITYTKDQSHVYESGGIIQAADPTTFEVIQDKQNHITGYAKDVKHVYVLDNILVGADPTSFALIEDGNGALSGGFLGYAKDATSVYTGMQRVEEADPFSFVSINLANGDSSGYVKDKNHVFTTNMIEGTTIVTGADPQIFKPVHE